MKAEQRKELETNTLADKMGHMMQRVKAGQRRSVLFYFLAALGVLVCLFLGYRWYEQGKQKRSMEWIMLYDGGQNHVGDLARGEDRNTPAGKAARLQIAWFHYWDLGVKMIAANQHGALQSLQKASLEYENLVEDCKDDPIFEPQALLGQAVTRETLAVHSRANLKKAKDDYQAVVDKYKDSAEAKFAGERLKILKDDAKLNELAVTYGMLQDTLQVPQPQQRFPNPQIQDLLKPKAAPKK